MNLFFYLQTFILNYSFIAILSDHIFLYIFCFIKTQPSVKRKPVKTGKKIPERSRSVLGSFTVFNAFPLCLPHLRFTTIHQNSCWHAVTYKRKAWSLTPDTARSWRAALDAALGHRHAGSRLITNDVNTNMSDFILGTQTFHDHRPKQTISHTANKNGEWRHSVCQPFLRLCSIRDILTYKWRLGLR